MNIKTTMNAVKKIYIYIHDFQRAEDSTEEYGGQDEKQNKTI